MSWPLVTIKSVGKVITGKTPSKKVEEYFGGDIPFISPAELSDKPLVLSSKQTLSKSGAAQIKLVPKNSVLVCCIGSLGKLAIADRELGTNQQINSVVFDSDKVFPKFGYYALSLLKPILISMAPATTVPIINKSKFEELKIPLPPLAEQKRIAAILDKADNIRQKRQQAIKLADDFLRSVFLDMFGDPITWDSSIAPNGWKINSIENIAHLKRGYDLPVQSRCEGEIDIVAANGIVGKHNQSKVQGPGVITGRSGTIGKVIYADNDFWPLNTSLYVTNFNGNNRRYIEYFLRYFKLERYVQGAGVPTLNRNLFLNEISLTPPKELQDKFEAVYEQTMKSVSSFNIFSNQALFNSLSQKAFAGDL